MRASELLNPAERMRIETAVREVERSTRGELVVCVVDACDEYGSAGWRLGCLLAALALLGLLWLRPASPAAALLLGQTVALAFAHWVARVPFVRRAFLDEALIEQRTRERATRAFSEHGLARTANRTGILIFVATFERRVVVLADEGVTRALGPGENWQAVVDLATAGLRERRAAAGIEAAVRRCGAILARVAPPAGFDTDELPRALIVES